MDESRQPVTRGAMERVLARAAELQASSGDSLESDSMTEAQLVELGKEVGLSAEHLRQALAEERARGEEPADRDGLSAAMIGGRRVAAQRVVPGGPDEVLAALDRWMQNEEWLRVKRQQRDRMVWEPRRDLMAGLRRAFAGRSHVLHVATDIAATVVSVDSSRSLVALTADLAARRSALIIQTSAIAALSAAATGVLSLLGFMAIAAIAPVAVVTPLAVLGARRAMAGDLMRAQDALEQILDRLERRAPGPGTPSLLQMIDSALPRLR